MAKNTKSKTKTLKNQTVNKYERSQAEASEASVKHKSFKLSQLPKIDNTGLPSSFALLWSSLKDIYRYRYRTFFFILTYGLPWYGLTVSAGDETADAVYGLFFGIIATLASIWMVRHREVGDKVTIRGAYYRGMTQLVPFILITGLLSLQIAPGYLGFTIYETVTASGAVVAPIELTVPIAIWAFLAALSFYWVVAGFVSLFVATIPGTLPMQAVKAGKSLVDGRRWFIFRRLIIFGAFIIAVYLFFVYWFAQYQWREALHQLSIIFPIVIIPFVNTYLYKIYNGLLSKNR